MCSDKCFSCITYTKKSLVMPNSDPRDGIFCPHRTLVFDSFSCIPFDSECFIVKVPFSTTQNDVDVGNMTSL